jgi:hypothetical protein
VGAGNHQGQSATVRTGWEGGLDRKSQETCPEPKSFEGRQPVSRTNRSVPSAGFFIHPRGFDLHRAAAAALFTAAGVALGFALAHIPNVELVTTTIFISGYMLGIRTGLAVGALTEALYSGLNPLGSAAPPLFAAQIVSMATVGLMGGLLRHLKSQKPWMFGAAGFLLTLNFAVLTTVAYVLFLNLTHESLWASVIAGIAFYVTHLVSNTLIFVILVPPLIRSLKRNGSFQYLTKDAR